MGLHQDFKDLLAAFAERQVKYLLIGGYAVTFYARPRFTKDIDLWIDRDPENRRRVYEALAAFGAPEQVLEALPGIQPDEILYMGAPPARVDILQEVDGADFAAAFERRVEASWEGVPVSILGLDDLIATKRAAGRPQDLLDLAVLEKVRQRWK